MTPIALETAASYYKASPGTRWFRWGLGAAQRLSPALAERLDAWREALSASIPDEPKDE